MERRSSVSAVETVRGPVALDALGPTLMHEHVFVMQPEPRENYGRAWGAPYWDEEERVADAIAKLTRLRQGGITTIVDPTVLGLGRNIERIQRINAAVDLNIIVATGVYAFLEMLLGNHAEDPRHVADDLVVLDCSASIASGSITSTQPRIGSARCRRWSGRATPIASISRMTPPASTTSWCATRSSKTRSPTTCSSPMR